jgi:hypothetical protein
MAGFRGGGFYGGAYRCDRHQCGESGCVPRAPWEEQPRRPQRTGAHQQPRQLQPADVLESHVVARYVDVIARGEGRIKIYLASNGLRERAVSVRRSRGWKRWSRIYLSHCASHDVGEMYDDSTWGTGRVSVPSLSRAGVVCTHGLIQR